MTKRAQRQNSTILPWAARSRLKTVSFVPVSAGPPVGPRARERRGQEAGEDLVPEGRDVAGEALLRAPPGEEADVPAVLLDRVRGAAVGFELEDEASESVVDVHARHGRSGWRGWEPLPASKPSPDLTAR